MMLKYDQRLSPPHRHRFDRNDWCIWSAPTGHSKSRTSILPPNDRRTIKRGVVAPVGQSSYICRHPIFLSLVWNLYASAAAHG